MRRPILRKSRRHHTNSTNNTAATAGGLSSTTIQRLVGQRTASRNVITYNVNTSLYTNLFTHSRFEISPPTTTNAITSTSTTTTSCNNNNKQEQQKSSLSNIKRNSKSKNKSIHSASIEHCSSSSSTSNIARENNSIEKHNNCNHQKFVTQNNRNNQYSNLIKNPTLQKYLSLLLNKQFLHNLQHHQLSTLQADDHHPHSASSVSSSNNNSFSQQNISLGNESCSNWQWIGASFQGNIQIGNKSEVKECYCAVKHAMDGLVIKVHDCVLIKSSCKEKSPFVAKVTRLFVDKDNRKSMCVLWYYQPEHIPYNLHHLEEYFIPQEVFASRHRDICSIECIDTRAYVLPSGTYARYCAEIRRRIFQRRCLPLHSSTILSSSSSSIHASGSDNFNESCSSLHSSNLPPPLPLLSSTSSSSSSSLLFCPYFQDLQEKPTAPFASTAAASIDADASLVDNNGKFPVDISHSTVFLCRGIFDVESRRVFLHPGPQQLLPTILNKLTNTNNSTSSRP